RPEFALVEEKTVILPEKQTKSQERKSTIVKRIEKLSERITSSPSPKPKLVTQTELLNPHPGFTQESCVICGAIRLDPDLTGLTCGQARCLLELGKNFSELKEEAKIFDDILEELKEIATKLDLGKKEKLPEDPKGIFALIQEKIEPIEHAYQYLIDAAGKLGLDTEELSSDTAEEIHDEIKEKINELKEKLEEAAESLGLDPSALPDSLTELCESINAGASEIKTAVETVEEKAEESEENQKTDQ
ncbi:unnamed protein product, partial [marine sediment metagenome]